MTTMHEMRLAVVGVLVFISILYLQQTQMQPSTNVTVSPASANEVAVQLKEACKATDKETCYALRFEKISYDYGPDYAFNVLDALQNIDRDAQKCHFIAHGIGYGTYKRNPEDAQNQIASIDTSCALASTQLTISAGSSLSTTINVRPPLLNVAPSAYAFTVTASV